MASKRGRPDRSTGPACDAVPCPFAVVVDSNELSHGYDYKFTGLRTNADRGGLPLLVPLVYRSLPECDYMVDGLPGFAVERKTKADLFASVSDRENMVARLQLMSDLFDVAAIVIEAEISEIRSSPPPYTRYPVKSLLRSIQAWTLRYPRVHWVPMPGRAAAEAWTFRLLEKHWERRHRQESASCSR
jgi:ERCC4-type nuclease